MNPTVRVFLASGHWQLPSTSGRASKWNGCRFRGESALIQVGQTLKV